MLDRLSSIRGSSLPPNELRAIEPVPEQPIPDHQVTAADKGHAGSTGYGDRRGDSVYLSPRGLALAQRETESEDDDEGVTRSGVGQTPTLGAGEHATDSNAAADETGSGDELSADDRREVEELRKRDREVRAHEQAHAGAGGALTGTPQYEYETGPDGAQYAVGGEVSVSLREGNTHDETIRNAQLARRAALAPAEPSGKDQAVAAQASQMERRAEAAKAKEARETRVGASESETRSDQPTAGSADENRSSSESQSKSASPSDVDAPGKPKPPALGAALDAYTASMRPRGDDGSISLVA